MLSYYDYTEVIRDGRHRLIALDMYDIQYRTLACDIIYDDGINGYNSFAYGIFYDLTPKLFNNALRLYQRYSVKYNSFGKYENQEFFCRYEDRDLFTVRKQRSIDESQCDEWKKDFETLEEAMKCFKKYFDELVEHKNREVELSLIIHYKGYQRSKFGRRPHDFIISVLRVDFNTVWEYYNNAGFQLECYFYPIFDASVYGPILKEQRDYKNFAYQIFTDVRKLQGLHLNKHWVIE